MSKFLDRLRAARKSGARPPTSALVALKRCRYCRWPCGDGDGMAHPGGGWVCTNGNWCNARRALIAPAPPLPPMAPVFAPPPPCATCGAP